MPLARAEKVAYLRCGAEQNESTILDQEATQERAQHARVV